MNMKMIVVYDLEIYKNLFLYVAMNVETKEFYRFEISSRKDQRKELLNHLKQVGTMIGFNNLSFDYPILHSFIKTYKYNYKGKMLVSQLYSFAQQLINSKNRWNNMIKQPLIDQIDLLMINHYDNPAKMTSLKILEFNMQMNHLQNLPYSFDKILTTDEIQNVISYCDNDVNATYLFYLKNIPAIRFRNRMSNIYKQNLTNHNDVKIGGAVLLKALSDELGISEYEISKLRTPRESMAVSDIILPYITFQSIEMQSLLSWWKQKIIYETKGQFSGIPLEEVNGLLPYMNQALVKGKLKNLNIILNGFQFDFGTGGIHGTSHPGIWKSDDDGDLILVDVSSYYPNLAAKNGFHPAHIPKAIFIKIILMLYDQRMLAKSKNDNEMVKSIKLALNGYLYGNSNSEYSFMFDPMFMMKICLNGQLLLVSLAEQIMGKGIELIQANTDGLLVKCRKDQKAALDAIVKQWENLTNLKLDYDHFDLIIQRDVNNYYGRMTNGKIKLKGAFDYNYAKNGDWHKNFSMIIVAKGLEAYFVKGITPERFVTTHDNMNDFFIRTKYGKNTKLVQRKDGLEKQLQNVTRYYVAIDGYEFIKIMQPLKGKIEDREFQVESGFSCREMNDITDEKLILMKQVLNHQYYIDKIQDNIDKIEEYIAPENLSFELIDDI